MTKFIEMMNRCSVSDQATDRKANFSAKSDKTVSLPLADNLLASECD
ncbi:Hypothetical protein OINT_2001223 [Brucella intermedia LMG 3301]|uniref:Uncharacterized protein n=1 Tax=Brucella intermedia LMG 3301 TaxID=641118 RepID=C4WNU5_9HYPH|nr:Hypothetical protein OINT_2001223 [Brucella intermedia LMG 3301]